MSVRNDVAISIVLSIAILAICFQVCSKNRNDADITCYPLFRLWPIIIIDAKLYV